MGDLSGLKAGDLVTRVGPRYEAEAVLQVTRMYQRYFVTGDVAWDFFGRRRGSSGYGGPRVVKFEEEHRVEILTKKLRRQIEEWADRRNEDGLAKATLEVLQRVVEVIAPASTTTPESGAIK